MNRGPRGAGVLAALATLLSASAIGAQGTTWPTTLWAPRCVTQSEAECDLTDPAVEVILTQLQESSEWLQSLGFRPPNLPRDEIDLGPDSNSGASLEGWVVHLAEGWVNEASSDAGQYEIHAPEAPRLSIGTRTEFAFGETEYDNTGAATHELLHAVQGAYEFFREEDRWVWFIEGTAKFVQAVQSGPGFAYVRPYYDRPLHQLVARTGQQAADRYMSYEFWDFMGHRYGRNDRVDYLPQLFEAVGPGGGPDDPLGKVDGALHQFEPRGLFDIYPEFIATVARDEEDFDRKQPPIQLHDADGFSVLEGSAADFVEPVAADYIPVLVEALEPDRTYLLEIRLEGRRDPALHLVVDDERHDLGTAPPHGDRNIFRTQLTEPDSFAVRVVNVAGEAVSSSRTSYTLTARLLREYASIAVSGSERGSGPTSEAPEGPTPTEIAQPLDFDVAEGDLTVFYVTPDDSDDLELDRPVCTVWIKLRTEQDDALWVMGNLSSPIRPRAYPIVKAPGGAPDLLGSRLWTSRTAGRGRLQTFGVSGQLEIVRSDHLMVEGNVWTHVHQGLEGGDVNLAVQGEFGLQPGSMVSGILGPKAADHPCFSPDDTAKGEDPGRQEDPRDRKDSRKKTPEDDEVTEETGDGRGSGGFARASEDEDETDGVGAPGDPVARPPADGDAPPAEDVPTGDGAVAEASLQLEFLDQQGGSIRSRPQVAIGSHSPERVDVSASSFDVQLAIHQDRVWQCVETKSSGVAGIYALTGMGMSGATALDWDGWYRIDIREAGVRLDVDAGAARLEVDFEQCHEETGHCQSGLVVVRAGPGAVRLAPTGDGSTRVEVSAGTLVATVDRRKGSCDEFVDFSATLKVLP